MSYEQALQAAGAEVLEFKNFGSYQGEWWAKVRYNGELGWVSGYYGSCSGCDAFEAEFGYGSEYCDEHRYDDKAAEGCPDCASAKEAYAVKFKEFGAGYLTDLKDQAQAEKETAQHLEWDGEAQAMHDWVKEHAINGD